ncbi:hypothetical protein SH449x_004422 [Pirellulaceae bacterium SH449]
MQKNSRAQQPPSSQPVSSQSVSSPGQGASHYSQPSGLVRALVYALAIIHFSVLAIAYSGNWLKSSSKDRLITRLKPYLIGLNWNLEMFPVEWNRIDPDEGCARLVLKTPEGETFVALSTNSPNADRLRERQLLGLMNSMALNANDDGLSLLLASAVRFAEKSQSRTFSSIVIEQREYGTADYFVTYEAKKVLIDGAITFLPLLEPQRTVQSLVTASIVDDATRAEGVE